MVYKVACTGCQKAEKNNADMCETALIGNFIKLKL